MYLWSTVNRLFYYNAPSSAVPRQPIVGTALFGNALDATGVTGNVQLSSVLDGCTAIPAGSLTGKIGLVERGTVILQLRLKMHKMQELQQLLFTTIPLMVILLEICPELMQRLQSHQF
jgi:hypothetical protein